jgi:hypothetical protein
VNKFLYSLKEIDKRIEELAKAWTDEIEVEKRLSQKADEYIGKITRESP